MLGAEVTVGEVEVELLLWVSAHARDATPHDRLQILLRLADPAACHVNDLQTHWEMTALPSTDGPFARAIIWALDHLHPDGACELEPGAQRSRDANHARLHKLCAVAAGHAVALCDVDTLGVALLCPEEARLFVYGALLRDTSGRIAEMLATCPGVLRTAAMAFDTSVVGAILEGAPVSQLLRDAFARTLHGPEVSSLLVQRAPADVRPAWVSAALRTSGIDVNDMPCAAPERFGWYHAVYRWSCLAHQVSESANRYRFGSFVSKHAVELEALSATRATDAPCLLSEIVDWMVRVGGPVPSRRSSCHKLVAAVEEWHSEQWSTRGFERDRELPAGPHVRAAVRGISASQITTTGELLDEGRVMAHCAGSLVHSALGGTRFFYRATVDVQRVTIVVAPAGDRWRLCEARGFANARVSALHIVDEWVRQLRTNRSCYHVAGTAKNAT